MTEPQEIAFDDIRVGDRVRRVEEFIYGRFTVNPGPGLDGTDAHLPWADLRSQHPAGFTAYRRTEGQAL